MTSSDTSQSQRQKCRLLAIAAGGRHTGQRETGKSSLVVYYSIWPETFDGRNPAPAGMYKPCK